MDRQVTFGECRHNQMTMTVAKAPEVAQPTDDTTHLMVLVAVLVEAMC